MNDLIPKKNHSSILIGLCIAFSRKSIVDNRVKVLYNSRLAK
jgi:hypothetical protein